MKPKSGPAYLQIEQQLLSWLARNQYGRGDRIPTEHELMKMFSVSRTTIRKTLEILEARGLISRSRGSGTYYTGKSLLESPGKGRGKLLGLVNYFSMDYIYTEIIRGIEDEAGREGYSLIIANSNKNDDRQMDSIRRLMEQGVEGLIIEPKRSLQIEDEKAIAHSILENISIPIVTTHWGIAEKSVSTVTLDDVHAGRRAGRYLLENGHRDIAYIYKEDIQSGLDRLEGFRSALEAGGIALGEDRLFAYNEEDELHDALQGYIQTRKIFSAEGKHPTALFYFNDNLAVQGYRALAELGLRVPEDVSVLGFDDHNSASIVSPPLTTFEHPKYDLGRWGAKILIDEIRKEGSALPVKLLFEPRLIVRGSVRQID